MSKSETQKVIDYNIHGIVGVRFVDADPKVIDIFRKRYALSFRPSIGLQPDVLVKFSTNLDSDHLTYIGQNMAGFSSDAFYALNKGTGKVEVKIPFDSLGNRFELTYPKATKSLPFFLETLHLAFLRKGYIPVHASALVYHDSGVLIAGWQKGGKTGTLLSFMNHGAHFVGDEWVFVSADGSSMLGLPMPMSISEWQIKHIPRFAPEIKFQQQILFQSIKAIERLHTALKQTWLRKRYTFKWLDKALPYFKKQLKIYTLPQDLFRNQVGNLKAVPQKIFLILGHPGPDIRIERSDAAKLALQFAQVSEYELQDFMKYYQAYKFAFPGIENDFLEDVSNLQRRLLKPALAGKDAFTVYYPYGESLELLFEKINSFCFSDNKNASASDLKELNLAPISRETIK